MIRFILFFVLMSCADPLSNALFYADADFAVALPGDERLALPLDLVTQDVVASDLHAAALEQLTLLSDALAPLARSGQALRTSPPDERTETLRSWLAVPVVGADDAVWWTRSGVAREASGSLVWTLDIANRADGPYLQLAEGRHDPHSGVMVYGVDRDIEVSYGISPSGLSELRLRVVGGRLNRDGPMWTVTEAERLTWQGTLRLQSDEQVRGVATALATATGGRVDALTDDGIEMVSCWDADGVERWAMQGGQTLRGSEAACDLPAPP